ncbi:DUF262 domain-containing protein [uncultured Ilyobacter sp.]|uniref:DUF262 domain-containing protein n=1 Tax=uncultured Ilyobacter sp. TaxID=544433 RepID=UPI0029F4B464|nr:DUF262 domain-containing protein [uncultured Ilyobacter sp.]
MEARQTMMLQFLSGEDKKFIIPVFQRNYDWKFEQCKQLFKDIETLIVDKNRKTHFLGTIVYIANNEVDMIDFREFLLIDGQQRVTTTMLLLKALYDKLKEKDTDSSIKLSKKILKSYLINEFSEIEEEKLRLKPMKEDNETFKIIMSNNLTSVNKNSNIYKNYTYFLELFENSKIDIEDFYKGIQRLVIVFISLKRGDDDPQLIFESLNSTGLNLSQADLIRNFILMDKEPREQEKLFELYWYKLEKLLSNETISEFIRDYLTMKQRVIPKKDNVYFEFKKFVNNQYSNREVNDLLEELLYFSEIYSNLINCNSENKKINILLQKIKKLKMTVSYPFLMEVFDDYKKEQIELEEMLKILKLIENYVFRRVICEIPTNALNKVFQTLGRDLKNILNYKESYYKNIKDLLILKKYSAIFPTDEMFRNSFINKNIYKFKYNKFLLEELENYKNKEKVNIEELSIEHIMPQTLDLRWKVSLGKNYERIHEKYLHTIGNISLTGYNSHLGNKTFLEKKEILLESRLKLNGYFKSIEVWGEEQIIDRAEKILEIALNNWGFPEISEELKKENIILEKEFFDLSDDLNVTGLKPVSFEFMDKKYQVDSWRGFFQKVGELMYEFDYSKLLSLTEDIDFSGKNSRIILKNSQCREPIKITEDIFFEGNLNSNAVLNYIKIIFEKYNFQEHDLKYWLKQ